MTAAIGYALVKLTFRAFYHMGLSRIMSKILDIITFTASNDCAALIEYTAPDDCVALIECTVSSDWAALIECIWRLFFTGTYHPIHNKSRKGVQDKDRTYIWAALHHSIMKISTFFCRIFDFDIKDPSK